MSTNKFSSISKSTRKERLLKRTIIKNIDELNNKNNEIKNLDYNLRYYKTYSENSYNYNVHLINLIHSQEKLINSLKNQIQMLSNQSENFDNFNVSDETETEQEIKSEIVSDLENTDYSYTKCTR